MKLIKWQRRKIVTHDDLQYVQKVEFLPGEKGGLQFVYKFPNGYGASVIRHKYSYGGDQGLWELGVTRWKDDDDYFLTYDTPITNDVIGYLETDEVQPILERIKGLK